MKIPHPAPPEIRTPGTVWFREFVAFVSLYDGPEVRVRYRSTTAGPIWKCDRCGHHRAPTCPHQHAAHAARVKEWNPR